MADLDMAGSETGDSGFLTKLPTILWERKWFVIVPTIILFIAGCAAALLLPTTYQSRSVMLVETPSLIGQPENAGEDNEVDRQIAKIRQQLMSRPDLVELIQTHNLYDASSNQEPLSKLVDRLRDATDISAVDANILAGSRGRGGQSSIAFSLTFQYPRADLAQIVAQTFTDRLLKLSTTQNQDSAQNSVRVLEDQADTLQQQLTSTESQINTVSGQNGAALASAQAAGPLSSGGTYESQIAALQRENAQLRTQTGGVALERDPSVVSAEARLAAIRAQYSDDHPDVAIAKSQLAAARANAAQLQTRAVNGSIQAQLDVNNAAIAQLQQARNTDRGRAAQLAAAQSRGPAAAARVGQLQAQAELIRSNLARINGLLLNARSAAKMTEEQRGDRLTLIEPPVLPDTPASPNRPLLVAAGLLGGLVVGVGLALLLELILRPIRSVAAIKQITGVAPLAVVPSLSNRALRAAKPKRRGWFAFRLPFRRRAATDPI